MFPKKSKNLFLLVSLLVVVVLAVASTTVFFSLVSAQRLSHSYSAEDAAQERVNRMNRRRPKSPNERDDSRNANSNSGSNSASASKAEEEAEAEVEIVIPQVVGRGRHGWSHHQREIKESREAEKQQDLASVHPLMAHLSTEERASLLLFSKVESRFNAASTQARQLLQDLHDLNPHHAISAKYERMEAEAAEKAKAKAREESHLDKVQALDNNIRRLEYQLQDTKTFAEEIAKDAYNAREESKVASQQHSEGIDKAKKDCDTALENQEKRVSDVELELTKKTEEIIELKKSVDMLTGNRDASSSQWKMMLIRHADFVMIGIAVGVPILLILAFVIGRGSSASNAGKRDFKKTDGDIFSQQQSQQPQQQQNSRAGDNNNAGANDAQSGEMMRNRALRRYDGSV